MNLYFYIVARIAGINIPQNKKIWVALTYIYGIGDHLSKNICKAAVVDLEKRVYDLTDEEVLALRTVISSYKVEGELRGEVDMNIKRLKDIGCYVGRRHQCGLPVRGQNTQKNSRTRKGRRKTVANKKKAVK